MPLKDARFASSAKRLFNLSDDRIQRLVSGFEEAQTTCSAIYVKKLLNLDVPGAIDIRDTLIFLIHSIHSHKIVGDIMVSQLGSVGCNKDRVRLFSDLIQKLPPEALLAAETLQEVTTSMSTMNGLDAFKLDINYTMLDPRADNVRMLFPHVRLTLITRSRIGSRIGKDRMEIDMDAQEFEAFMEALRESLSPLTPESEALKKALGDSFTSLTK